MKPFHCRGKDCKAVLGHTDGIRLYITVLYEGRLLQSNVVFVTKTLLVCALCGYVSHWRPVLPPLLAAKRDEIELSRQKNGIKSNPL